MRCKNVEFGSKMMNMEIIIFEYKDIKPSNLSP
jgi:hypothetical protein